MMPAHLNLLLSLRTLHFTGSSTVPERTGQRRARRTAGGSRVTFSKSHSTRESFCGKERTAPRGGEGRTKDPHIWGAPELYFSRYCSSTSICTCVLGSSFGLLPVHLCPLSLWNFSNAPDFLAGLTSLWWGKISHLNCQSCLRSNKASVI